VTRLADQSGQALVLMSLFVTVLLGMAAVCVDVGTWYHADRQAQAAADAAALAAAQALPYDPTTAEQHAERYADENGGGLKTVAIGTTGPADGDTVTVEIERAAPGFFSKVLGVDSVTVGAKASARAAGLGKARWVAPIVVSEKHEKLVCGLACFGPLHETELDYHHLASGGGGKGSKDHENDPDDGSVDGGSGSFGFINLNASDTNGVPTNQLGDWLRNGYDQYIEPGSYNTSTGNPFSSSHVSDALNHRLGDVLLFPVYKSLAGTGSNARYDIVAFVGFRLTGMKLSGSDEKLFGYFTEIIWDGIPGGSPSPDYGARSVALVE
jgi:Putative Flp pilus-assembly TadE/G-like